MLLEQGLDEPVELGDAAQQRLQLLGQTADHQAHGPDDTGVPRQRLSGSNLSDLLVEVLQVPAVVGPIELPDLAGSRGLELLQAGPALEKVTGLGGIEAPGPFQSLGKKAFQQAGELVGQSRALSDQFAPVFHRQLQLPGEGIFRCPAAEPLGIFLHHFPKQIGILGIIFGSRRVEGFAVAGQGFRVDGVEIQKVGVHQGIQQWATGLFQDNSDGMASKALAQLPDPALQGFGLLSEL